MLWRQCKIVTFVPLPNSYIEPLKKKIMIQTKIKKRFALVILFLSFIISSHAQIMQGGVAANAISLDVDKLYDFAEGYAVVAKNGQTALINFNLVVITIL